MPRGLTWPNDPQTYFSDAKAYRIIFAPGGTSVPITNAGPIPLCSTLPEVYHPIELRTQCSGDINSGALFAGARPVKSCTKDSDCAPFGCNTNTQLCASWECRVNLPAQSNAVVCRWADDVDQDGVRNFSDIDADNDGIPNADEVFDAVIGESTTLAQQNEGLNNPDGDGIPNELDLDSDGDGIPDVIEAGGEDENGDGLVDDFTDEDQDGLADRLKAEPLKVPDTDEDVIPDFLDGDSDDDGATDVREAGGEDDDGDGMLDDSLDGDGDGLADSVEDATGDPLPLFDIDGDGVPDFQDSTQSTGGGGCSVASVGSTSSLPLYLLLPVFVVIRRLLKRYRR